MKTREFVYTTPEIPGQKTKCHVPQQGYHSVLNTCPRQIDFFLNFGSKLILFG